MPLIKQKPSSEVENESSDEYVEETDSETEMLQEAYAKGFLKPGLNKMVIPKKFENNVPLLREKLAGFKLDFPWVEKLDVTSKLAPLAPELSVQLEQSEKEQNPIVHDDFKRESLFYRQAQDAVISILPKLKGLGIPTQRPEDYFAEMAKSDKHMQKVKVALVKQKTEVERVEKVRALRAQKKLQKAMNAQARLAQQNSKKELMNEVKKFRKGETKDLSFLDKNKKKTPIAKNKRAAMKKKHKDSKFGFGGKKRGLKKNTRDSSAGIDSKPRNPKSKLNKRPGKSVRNKTKGKRKS